MENIGWGLQMTVLGMGLVFALLAMLWGLLNLVLKLDKEPEPVPAVQAQVEAERIAAEADDAIGAQVPMTPTVNGMPADLVAAILVATHKHRKTMRREAAPLVRSVWPGSHIFASRWLATGRARQNNNWQPRGR